MGVRSVDWCSSARGVRSLSPRSPLLIPRTYFTLCCLTLSHKLSLSVSVGLISLYVQFFCVCISNAHGFMAIARHTTQHSHRGLASSSFNQPSWAPRKYTNMSVESYTLHLDSILLLRFGSSPLRTDLYKETETDTKQ